MVNKRARKFQVPIPVAKEGIASVSSSADARPMIIAIIAIYCIRRFGTVLTDKKTRFLFLTKQENIVAEYPQESVLN